MAAETTSGHLKAKFQIGSCKGRIDYLNTERVFHPADVPQKAKDAKKWVTENMRSHKLANNPPWNQSTHTGTYYSATRPAPWDQGNYENRYFAQKETDVRLQREAAYKQGLLKGFQDPKNVNPRWNGSTQFEPTRVPAQDHFFSQPENRANDFSKSLKFGNESYIVPEPHIPPDGTMKTITGKTQLGTGLPYTSALDMSKTLDMKKTRTKLPIDYEGLVERQRRRMKELRASRAQREAAQPSSYQLANSSVFSYPDVPNFSRTKPPDPKEVAEAIKEKYTADSLTQYLETLELSQTQQLNSRQIPV